MVGRILGLDYGRRRVGLSISDPLKLTAQPLDTWEGLSRKVLIEKLLTLVEHMDIERIVIGFPLTMKGDKGTMARTVEKFADELSNKNQVSVILWDERLTSVQAQRILRETGYKTGKKKGIIDMVASVLILQNYLDHLKGPIGTSPKGNI